jgi:hypothetical protein
MTRGQGQCGLFRVGLDVNVQLLPGRKQLHCYVGMACGDGSQKWWQVGTPSPVHVNAWVLEQATDYFGMALSCR